MRCTTCQQTDFKSLHGRVFCANCGVDAEKRLQAFQTQAHITPLHKIGTEAQPSTNHVLDLSAVAQTKTIETPPAIVQSAPASHPSAVNSLSGLSGPMSQAAEAPPLATASTTTVAPPRRSGWQRIETAPSAPEPAPLDLSAPAAFSQATESAPAVPATPMQPHQTYSVKGEPAYHEPVETPSTLQQNIEASSAEKPQSRFKAFLSKSLVRSGAIALSIMLLGTYITYLNYPGIAVRVAASRANVNAELPGYLPAGYSFSGPVAYTPGQLRISFTRGNNGKITLSQSTTRWDSSSLLEDHIKLKASTYDTYRENGLTIYTFDGRYAAWVNSGMLYEIESDTEITPHEIIKMASSL